MILFLAGLSGCNSSSRTEMCIRDRFKALAKDLTLHIAAAAPKSVSSDSLDPAFVAEEQEIAKQVWPMSRIVFYPRYKSGSP